MTAGDKSFTPTTPGPPVSAGRLPSEAALRSRWKSGSWIGAGRPTAGISSEPWPSTTKREGRPLVRHQHRHPRAEAGRGVLPLSGRGERRPGGRGGLRKHLAEGGEPGGPVLRRLVRRGRGERRREPAAAGGRPPGPRQDPACARVDAALPARPASAERQPSPSSARASRRSSARSPTKCSCRGRRTNGTCA